MKKKILFLLLVLIPLFTFGQGGHEEGVVISDSARIEGFARIIDSLISEGLAIFEGDLVFSSGDTLNYIKVNETDTVISINSVELGFGSGGGGGGGMIYPDAGIALSTGSAWGTSITNNSTNWNSAFGWGDHSGLYLAPSDTSEMLSNYAELTEIGSNTDVAANTSARHNGVTLGTANGLSLSTQELSLALSSTSTTGSLSDTDWDTFNDKLGGTLNAATTVTGTNTNTLRFESSNGSNGSSYFSQSADFWSLRTYPTLDYSGSEYNEIYFDKTTIGIRRDQGLNSKEISITAGSFLITDSEDDKGLEYAADYTAQFTEHSLVTKGFVEGDVSVASLASAGIITGKMKSTPHTDAIITLTADSCLNILHFNNDAGAITFDLPVATRELVVMFYDNAGGVITLHPNGTNVIKLNGTALDAGDTIDSPGNDGDFIVLYCMVDGTWVTLGRAGTWIDGGA